MTHEVKICPLMTMGKIANPDESGIEECLKQDCAWWSKDNQSCAIVHISKEISLIDCRG